MTTSLDTRLVDARTAGRFAAASSAAFLRAQLFYLIVAKSLLTIVSRAV